MAKRPEITIANGPLAGKRFNVGEGGLRLGRSSSNDIHIPDEALSRNHCLFEPIGLDGLRVTDLASANGTMLNGKMLGDEPATLKAGDEIVVGDTTLRIGDLPPPPPKGVDLGLGAETVVQMPEKAEVKRRSVLSTVLWAVCAVLVVFAICLVLLSPAPETEDVKAVEKTEVEPALRELQYERVRADSSGIFRYMLTLAEDGVLTVRVDDVPTENRHHVKSQPLSKEAKKELGEILAFSKLKEIDREYAGIEPDPPALDSWDLRVVYDTRARRITISNTQEPEAFRTMREKLEAFSKSELGVWAIQYPRAKLIELAEQSIELGNAKWEDRDVNHGNLAESIAAYKEAIFYLETVNPKPPCGAVALDGMRRSIAELDSRYAEQRFRADKALNLSQWEKAREELLILVEMVPDRKDDRNRDARSKLLSAESNLKKKKGGRK